MHPKQVYTNSCKTALELLAAGTVYSVEIRGLRPLIGLVSPGTEPYSLGAVH